MTALVGWSQVEGRSHVTAHVQEYTCAPCRSLSALCRSLVVIVCHFIRLVYRFSILLKTEALA